MSLLFALALAQQGAYSPEIEALLRQRDEKRQQEMLAAIAREPETKALSTVMSPEQAGRLSACLASADSGLEAGLEKASAWEAEGGGPYAAQCRGYAHVQAGQYAEGAAALEAGGALEGNDAQTRGRLFSQAGNAALAAGDVPRALRDFDSALKEKLPPGLATGEIHLDRARTRVAAGDTKGARADFDAALVMAPTDPLAWLLSATLARRMDDLPVARAHIEQAARLSRNDANIAIEQGVIYALSGDRDEAARAAFSRAAEVARPDSEEQRKAQAYLAQLDALAPKAAELSETAESASATPEASPATR